MALDFNSDTADTGRATSGKLLHFSKSCCIIWEVEITPAGSQSRWEMRSRPGSSIEAF